MCVKKKNYTGDFHSQPRVNASGAVIQNTNLELKVWLCYSLFVQLWACCLTPLGYGFPICETWKTIPIA